MITVANNANSAMLIRRAMARAGESLSGMRNTPVSA